MSYASRSWKAARAGPVGGDGEVILMLGQELWAVKRLATHLRKSDTLVNCGDTKEKL